MATNDVRAQLDTLMNANRPMPTQNPRLAALMNMGAAQNMQGPGTAYPMPSQGDMGIMQSPPPPYLPQTMDEADPEDIGDQGADEDQEGSQPIDSQMEISPNNLTGMGYPPQTAQEFQPTDEDMLNMVQQGMGGQQQDTQSLTPFTGDPEQDRAVLQQSPTDANIDAFIELHGEDELPDDMKNPDPNAPDYARGGGE